ncbi:MAG TPA: TIGR02300 family protein [Caulobacteraceae bacterium]|nr:TIGR02300 family protein [Caulobacteraceae bacterium]
MANPELGAKQICPACASKFYDLGRRPAVCPKCATQFDPEEALRNRRVRARTTPADYEAEEEAPKPVVAEADGFEDEADDTPEVDEAAAEPIVVEEDGEEAEGGAPAPPADDLGVDFAEEEELEEDSAEVPFLVDEDDEDDNFEDEIEGLPDDEPD